MAELDALAGGGEAGLGAVPVHPVGPWPPGPGRLAGPAWLPVVLALPGALGLPGPLGVAGPFCKGPPGVVLPAATLLEPLLPSPFDERSPFEPGGPAGPGGGVGADRPLAGRDSGPACVQPLLAGAPLEVCGVTPLPVGPGPPGRGCGGPPGPVPGGVPGPGRLGGGPLVPLRPGPNGFCWAC